MLQIHHAEPDAPTPSKAYADACWRTNPRLSPDWWREALGSTVGKIALDWRTYIHGEDHLATGCNLLVTTPQTAPQAHLILVAQASPSAFVEVRVLSNPAALTAPWPHFALWNPSTTPPHLHADALIQLENHVKSGHIEAYGLAFDSLPEPTLTEWLKRAADAAETAYSRKKRPSLKVILAPLDLTNLSLLTAEQEVNKTQNISVLELAVRLGLAVIATPAVLPGNPLLLPESLACLTHAAELEHALNQELGGWPQAHGQHLFSILAHLAQGHTPWPTPTQWHNWVTHLYPQLATYWQSQPSPLAAAYLQSLYALLPHGANLAASAAQPIHDQLLETLSTYLTAPWQNLPVQEKTLAIITAIPGVTTVAITSEFQANLLQNITDIPDIGAVLRS